MSELRQSIQCRTHGVKGIASPQRLGNNIVGAYELHDGSHRSTRNDARAFDRRLQQDVLAAE
jgi:hypothetical protein